MASEHNGTKHEPAIVEADINLCNEPLVEPLLELQLLEPLSFMLRNGTTFTFPPGITIYISPADIAYELGKAFQRIAAHIQRAEEDRLMRLTKDQLLAERAKYIPF